MRKSDTNSPYDLQAELSIMAADGRTYKFGRRTAAWHNDSTGDDWMVAGMPSDNADKGQAVVFERAAGQSRWKQIATLTAGDGVSGDGFGEAVAMREGVIAVGAPSKHEPLRDDSCACNVDARVGAVYLFVSSAPDMQTWKQPRPPITGRVIGEEYADYGSSLAFSKNFLAIGVPGLGLVDGGNTGGVILYTVSTGLSSLLKPTTSTYARVGEAVAITTLPSGLDRVIAGSYDDDIGAAYIFDEFDTAWRPVAKLVPSDGAQFDGFGLAVSINGGAAVVGAPGHNGFAGSVYSFIRDGAGDWVSDTRFDSPNGLPIEFGASVSLLGARLAIGALVDDDGSGAVYLYERLSSSWSEPVVLHGAQRSEMGTSAILLPDVLIAGSPGWNRIDYFSFDGTNWEPKFPIFLSGAYGDDGESFGQSVSIAGDTAVVAAPSQQLIFGGDVGVADVFLRDHVTGQWLLSANIADVEPGYSAFGFHLCDPVLVNGDNIFVGIPDENFGAGAVHVYARSGTSWNAVTTLTPSVSHTDDLFGCSLALSADTLVIGAPGLDSYSGGAYVFKGGSGTWAEAAQLQRDHPMPNDYAGAAAAINGNTIVLGAPFSSGSVGAALVFSKNLSGSWDYLSALTPHDHSSAQEFGASVSVSDNRIAIGAPMFDATATSRAVGAVYVFEDSSSAWTQSAEFDGSHANGNLGSAVQLEHDLLAMGEPGNDDVEVVTHTMTGWSSPSYLNIGQPSLFGSSLAISNNSLLVGAPNGGNAGGGRAYIFSGGDTIFADGFQ